MLGNLLRHEYRGSTRISCGRSSPSSLMRSMKRWRRCFAARGSSGSEKNPGFRSIRLRSLTRHGRLVPAISIDWQPSCHGNRDRRAIGERSDAVLRTAMPAMTVERAARKLSLRPHPEEHRAAMRLEGCGRPCFETRPSAALSMRPGEGVRFGEKVTWQLISVAVILQQPAIAELRASFGASFAPLRRAAASGTVAPPGPTRRAWVEAATGVVTFRTRKATCVSRHSAICSGVSSGSSADLRDTCARAAVNDSATMNRASQDDLISIPVPSLSS